MSAAKPGELALMLRMIRDYLGPRKLTLFLAVVCMAGGAATTAALAWLLDPAIKLIFLDQREDMLLLIPAAIVVVVLLRAGFNYGETVFSSIVGQSIVADVQRDMVRSMAALDLERLNRVHSGQLISNLLYDVNLLREAVVRGVAGIAKESLSLLLLGSVMIYQDWRLSLIAVLALPIIAWVTRALGRTTQKASVKGMVETGELATALSEMLDGRRIVKAYGLENQALARADDRIEKRMHHFVRATKARAASAPASDFFGGLAMALAILYAGYEGMAGRLELNQFASFVGAMLLAQTPVRALSQLWTAVKEGLGATQRVYALIDTKPSIVDAPNATKLKIGRAPFGGSVRFETVSFAYHPGADALDSFTCDVPAGKKIALVGPSGAGKSTVFNLLLRFYDATRGRITVDGQDIRSVTLESLRAGMALVTQEPFLFDDTVGANIGCGRDGATAGRHRVRRQGRGRARVHPQPSRRLQHACRRRRAQALRRSAPAHRDRARDAARCADPAARRSDIVTRQRERAPGAGRAEAPDEGPHDDRHRASPDHGARCGRHLRARSWTHRRIRHAWRTDGEEWSLRAPVPA